MIKKAGILIFIIIVGIFISIVPANCQVRLIPAGSEWKYLDNGSNQGSSWREPVFNDSSWNSGFAQFGFGDGDEVTIISYGPDPENKYITTYFRKCFKVRNPSLYAGIKLSLLRDDGAVVYLNGTEVCRANLQLGEINYLTTAYSGVLSSDEIHFFESYIEPDLLNRGRNVIAVEIHLVSVRSEDMSFDLELSTINETPDYMRKAPYLIFPGINTEMQVAWQLTNPDTCFIEWGIDTNYTLGSSQTYEYGIDHQHTFTLENLTPGTRYYYRVEENGYDYTGNFFAAPAETSETMGFIIYGDIRSFPAIQNDVVEMMVSTYEENPEFQSLILCAGDLVEEGYCEADWDEQMFDPRFLYIQQMHSEVPFQSCKGNHEFDGYIYNKYFPYPYVSDFYWSFDYGPAHFAVFDQFVLDSTSAMEEVDWLESDLASTDKPWKFIIFHKPGWSAGVYENDMKVQTFIQPLCVQYGVAMVFAGHNHYYARALVEGIQHITTGGGGGPLYLPDPTYPNVMTAAMCYHFCKVEIDGERLDFTAVALGDSIIDRFNLDLNSPVSLTTIIDSLPVIIPSSGGALDFTVMVLNSSGLEQEFDLWTMLTLPNGNSFGPMSNIPDIIIPADTNFYFDFSEVIGDTLPSGDYLHHSYAGIFSDSIYSEDNFEFEKLESAGAIAADYATPDDFYLYPPCPNPFNQSTVVGYQLSAKSFVNLTVYDIMGREVAKLVDGYKNAGTHEVIFDAKDLVSGVYFARLEAGEFRGVRKILLVK